MNFADLYEIGMITHSHTELIVDLQAVFDRKISEIQDEAVHETASRRPAETEVRGRGRGARPHLLRQ